MEELINILIQRREAVTAAIAEHYEMQLLASYTESGSIQIKINSLEKQLEEIENKLTRLKDPVIAAALTVPVKIFVFSSSLPEIQHRLSQDDFLLLPTGIYAQNIADWRPFSKDPIKIGDLINNLRAQGYRFTVYYLPDIEDDASVDLVEQDFGHNIAIIDLLSVDRAGIVKRFDRRVSCPVLMPIDSELHQGIRELMAVNRRGVFSYLERYFLTCSLYHNQVPHSAYLYRETANMLQKLTHSVSLIAGETDKRIPSGLSSTF